MPKLNQIIAIADGKKKESQRLLTDVYHQLKREEGISGFSRVYAPRDEDGHNLPPEEKRVQVRVVDEIAKARAALESVWNIIATQDSANQKAVANIVIDGKLISQAVPVTTLLYLEKQLTDVCTFIAELPTLDPAEEWSFDEAIAMFRAKPVETVRTQKMPRVLVKYAATKEHPAQVDTFQEDVPVGTWKTTKFSGAIKQQEKERMRERARKLLEAVKQAREEANSIEATAYDPAGLLLEYVFSK